MLPHHCPTFWPEKVFSGRFPVFRCEMRSKMVIFGHFSPKWAIRPVLGPQFLKKMGTPLAKKIWDQSTQNLPPGPIYRMGGGETPLFFRAIQTSSAIGKKWIFQVSNIKVGTINNNHTRAFCSPTHILDFSLWPSLKNPI